MIRTACRLVLALTVLATVSACTSSLDRVEKLSQADIPAADPALAALPADGATEATQERAKDLVGQIVRPAGTRKDTETARPRGFLGLFSGGGTARAGDTDTQVASAQPRGGGLFGGRKAVRDEGLPLGTVPTYGDVGRICTYRTSDLGRQVASHPERRPTYRIYDSNPGSTQRRAFYVTGFDDDCARVFSGALAMFGSAEMHEQLRYGLPAQVQPYSTTDTAYEKVKSRICRVGKGKPCGRAMSKLERDTVFVSVYENFGSNARWANMLLSGGDVVAQDIKRP